MLPLHHASVASITATARDVPNNNGNRVLGIHLPEDSCCTKLDPFGYCNCVVRTGGDLLEGSVGILAAVGEKVTVDVRFEGYIRTWVRNAQDLTTQAPHLYYSEVKFLDQIDTVKCRLTHGPSPAGEQMTGLLPFSFVIPTKLIPFPADSNPQLFQLYPSTKQGASFEHWHSAKCYMQPLIKYTLSATTHSKDQKALPTRSSITRGIKILPTSVARPPIYTEVFEDEYRLKSTTKVKRHFLSRSTGVLQLTAWEPEPINILDASIKAGTAVPLKVAFKPTDKTNHTVEPYKWTLRVRSSLCLRQFYATEPLAKEPTLRDIRKNAQMAVFTESIEVEEREYSFLTWSIDHLSCRGTIFDTSVGEASWTTGLTAIVATHKSLLPSYLSPMAALRYSVVVKVSILGFKTSHATVEVPLQVIRDPTSCRGRFEMSSYSLITSDIAQQQLGEPNDDEWDSGNEERVEPPEYRCWPP